MRYGWWALALLLPIAGLDQQAPQTLAPIRFEDVAPRSGIDFVLENCPTPEKHMIETMAGGLAVFDYDGDGRPDIFFTNGADLPSLRKTAPKYWNRLYHNDGNLQFRDVTETARIAGEGYSMGAAVGDYDNDGRPDLFVAGVNRNLLYHNLGNGQFEDVTEKAGIKSGEWAVAAGWFDYDHDGKLDVWIVHYAQWSVNENRYCGDKSRGIRIYCHPKYFQGLPSTLYHNVGNGRFEDVSSKAGLSAFAGRGMSVSFADYDGDGFPDVFVTNDNMPNFLFHNRGNGTFEEVGMMAGVALREDGKAVASMGTDFRDYDNDGLPDIAVTALAGETFPLFRNLGKGNFADATYASQIGRLSVRHSGWGTALVDFNNDGWKDLFTSNSHVNDRVEMFESAVYKEANGVFANLGGKFRDVSSEAGLTGSSTGVKAHRGSGYADFDGDGKVDAVISSLGAPVELWHNISPETNHWITLRLEDRDAAKGAIGTHVTIGDQHNDSTSAVSYASSSVDGVHFGLGQQSTIPKIEIVWPGGAKQILTNVKADQFLPVREPKK